MKIKVIKSTQNELPQYATPGSSGMDLKADLWAIQEKFLFNSTVDRDEDQNIKSITINPGGRALIQTGIKVALPTGYEAQIRPRSGLAAKYGVTVLNSPATIDADYRGDIGVILFNGGSEPFVVKQGDRIAQIVIMKVESAELEIVESLEETDRGEGGFGHTGV